MPLRSGVRAARTGGNSLPRTTCRPARSRASGARAGPWGPRRRGVACEGGERREVRRALGQPEMLMARPIAVVPLAALDLTAARAAVRVGAPGIEREGRSIVGADTAVDRQ